MGNSGQGVERRPGTLAAVVVIELLGQCLDGALVADLAQRANRGIPNIRVRVVDALEQRIASRAHLQPAGDARSASAHGSVVVVERFQELADCRL